MNFKRHLGCVVVATALLLVSSNVTAQESKFQTTQETGGGVGRYRVQIELRPGDDLIAVTRQLAMTYGARIEPYGEDGFTGFAIQATRARARLMSNDARVIAIVDLDPHSAARETPAEPAASAPSASTPTTERRRLELASEAVPGLGTYSYDKSGNITSVGDHAFRYDAFGRVYKSTLGALASQAYVYDRYGNIREIYTNGASEARMSVDEETNQMDLPPSGSPLPNMVASYDLAGNLIEHQQSIFVYDALNLMKETTGAGLPRRVHIYSASDERVAVVTAVNNVETTSEWTLRDGGNRVLRRLLKNGTSWQWKEDYIYAGSRLVAAEVPGPDPVRHFHLDHLGTPRLITGNNGAPLAEKTYDPFGRKVTAATPDAEQLEFTGHERDTPTLDYMHARYYKPDLGRFLSVDPVMLSVSLSNPQSWNRYSYAANNPLSFVDKNGMWPTATHEELIDLAFPGLSVTYRGVLYTASANADDPFYGGQNLGNSYKHMMRSESQTVAEAELLASDYYTGQIEAAISAATSGKKSASFDALYELGLALHMVADGSSPVHTGFQVWNFNASDVAAHIKGEKRRPTREEMAMAIAMMRSAYAQVFGVAAADAASKPPRRRTVLRMPGAVFVDVLDYGDNLYCVDGTCM